MNQIEKASDIGLTHSTWFGNNQIKLNVHLGAWQLIRQKRNLEHPRLGHSS